MTRSCETPVKRTPRMLVLCGFEQLTGRLLCAFSAGLSCDGIFDGLKIENATATLADNAFTGETFRT